MANLNDLFPSQYLRHADLQGRTVIVTIAKVEVLTVGQKRQPKPVAFFAGKQKGLIVNKTNALAIAALAGSEDTDQWVGLTLAIYPTSTTFAGSTVPCIRVKAAAARALPGRVA